MVYNPIPIQQNSISEIEISERRFSVFPNPTFSLVNIRTSNAKIDNGLIMDIHGKQISYGESNGNNYQFNLEKLASGVYVCIVECEGKEYRFKVIKQ